MALPVLPAAAAVPASGAAAITSAPGVRIAMITLGCDKNTVDSERVQARLAASGAALTGDPGQADVVVVNTCGFIDAAKEESIDTLLEAVQLKQAGRIRAVVALGCLVQRYKSELVATVPEVDLFLGLTEIDQLIPALRAKGIVGAAPNMQQPLRRLAISTRHTSYLKVSEGCDHTCAFCAIPLMRGKHRSTPMEQLILEARELEQTGVVELNLISQDTTWYGRDLVRGAAEEGDGFIGRPFPRMKGIDVSDGRERGSREMRVPVRAHDERGHRRGLLVPLLETLLRETSIPWLRLFYMYPSGIYPELIELMAREPRIVSYLDMPIQHGSDRMLTLMRRPERRATILERVSGLRSVLPDLSLRTTIIVGFPGETDEDFRVMLDLLNEVRFDYLGAFAYSVEEDTPAAEMPDQVPDTVKRERLEELLDVQRSITQEKNEARMGTITHVLIDRLTGRDSELLPAGSARGAVGRTPGQALEVDGVVHVADAAHLRPGSFVSVRLTDAMDQDMVGELVQPQA
ncbi:MAG: MiaB/RimO family radical SAM methylthiotransferase [Longimicrobiales bacterium]